MNLPENLMYTKDHEWAIQSGNIIKLGITDYAQDALGDVVYVGLPQVGLVVESGDSFAEVESTKSVSDVYSPVAGKIITINGSLSNTPEALNSDPYGEGWICEIEVDTQAPLTGLMSADEYREFISI